MDLSFNTDVIEPPAKEVCQPARRYICISELTKGQEHNRNKNMNCMRGCVKDFLKGLKKKD